MKRITEPLKQYLKAQDCIFEFDRKKNAVHFGMDATNARWRCMGCADEVGGFVLVSLIPLVAPENRRTACAELLVRINARLCLGHFDLDFSDGEMRFLTTVPLAENAELQPEVIENVIRGHHSIVDDFIPAISAVLFAGMPPDKAAKLDLENEVHTEPRFSLN